MTKRSTTDSQAGVTLIELIASIIIFGFIGVAATLFLTTGVSSFVTSRKAAEVGPKVQTALNRISLELRSADGLAAGDTVSLTANTSLTYTSTEAALTGTRMLRYAGGNLYIQVDGTDHLLLDGISAFTLNVTQDNLNGDATDGNEIATIDLSVTMTVAPANTFNLRVLPRQFIRL